MFRALDGFKSYEEDSYENGLIPNTGGCFDICTTFENETIEGLLSDIKNFYSVADESLLLNACDEDGRIDIQILENGDSIQPSDSSIELWKQGKKKLYLSTYTFHVRKVYEEPYRFS